MKDKKIILAGGSGFLGQALARFFTEQGARIVIFSRRAAAEVNGIRFVQWDGAVTGDWAKELDGAAALINLTGRSVDCRYNEANRREILESRLNATNILGEALSQCSNPPPVWLNAASATIYTDTRGELPANDEVDGVIGEGFSVDVCQAWEKAFWSIDVPGVRKICARIAIVLGQEGAMRPMTRLARLGLGGPMGDGQQYMSWLHEDDFVRMVDFLIADPSAEGTYNLASPHPVLNERFMCSMRDAVGAKMGLPSPAWLLAAGACMIKTEPELILKSRKVAPKRLEDAGFQWRYPQVDEALRALIQHRSA